MTQYLGEEVYKVVALNLNPDFRSFYDVTDANPPPVDHPDTYKPSAVGEVGYMEESAAFAARDAGDVMIVVEHTPYEIEQTVQQRDEWLTDIEVLSLVPEVHGADGAYARGIVGSLNPDDFYNIPINYLGSYGPNWGRMDVDSQYEDHYGKVQYIYVQFEGFDGEHRLTWNESDSRYHGTVAQGANPTIFQTWITGKAGQAIEVEIRRVFPTS